MKDHPIIFSAPMVLALLAGRKTQTRRLAWREPSEDALEHARQTGGGVPHVVTGRALPWQKAQPGDRLWVRENVCAVETADGHDGVSYAADDQWLPIQSTQQAAEEWVKLYHYRGRGKLGMGNPVPSIHMPRWASRLTLTVTEVRVQRLQEISEADAMAEGLMRLRASGRWVHTKGAQYADDAWHSARLCFASLWNSLHGPDAWDANPEVVALSFTVAQRNIDA